MSCLKSRSKICSLKDCLNSFKSAETLCSPRWHWPLVLELLSKIKWGAVDCLLDITYSRGDIPIVKYINIWHVDWVLIKELHCLAWRCAARMMLQLYWFGQSENVPPHSWLVSCKWWNGFENQPMSHLPYITQALNCFQYHSIYIPNPVNFLVTADSPDVTMGMSFNVQENRLSGYSW